MKKKLGVYLSHARTAAQRENMERIKKAGVDPFDWKQIGTYHAQPILRKGAHWLVTPNDYPYEGTALHLLLIHKRDIRLPSELSPSAWQELGTHIKWIEKKYRVTGGSLLMRFGDPALTGASVHHLHMHVIVGGKMKKDSEKLKVAVGYQLAHKNNVRRPAKGRRTS